MSIKIKEKIYTRNVLLLKFWRAHDDLHQCTYFAEFLQRLQLFAYVHISTLPVHLDEQVVHIFR